jgi:REP element-mobilizing transposase RayT
MPNHIHFLIRIKTEGELVEAFPNLDPNLQGFKNLGGCNPIEKRISQQFSNLFNSYTKAFNKMYERKGSLFIPNFKRKKIETDQHLTNIIHYIHANPVHHGFVETISVGPWSSYREIISEKQTWLMREEVVRWFGNINEFINFHLQPILFKSEIEKL